MKNTSFKALLFVQDKCEPCHRALNALSDAFDKSEFIEITAYKDRDGNKTEQARHYNIEATPTLVLVRPSGVELSRIKGSTKLPAVVFSKVARFLNEVNAKERVTAA
jgi:thioredoxin-related protein